MNKVSAMIHIKKEPYPNKQKEIVYNWRYLNNEYPGEDEKGDMIAVKDMLDKLDLLDADGSESDALDDMDDRARTVHAQLDTHAALNSMLLKPQSNFSQAIKATKTQEIKWLYGDAVNRQDLLNLNKAANKAKHKCAYSGESGRPFRLNPVGDSD